MRCIPGGYRPVAPKPHKYYAVRTELDGRKFASKREAHRYAELQMLQRAGLITDLKLQPRYPLTVGWQKIATYVGDFEYRDAEGRTVTEDAKGVRTELYKLKAKLFAALYGREIVEV